MKRYIAIICAFAAVLVSCTVNDLRDTAPLPEKGELIEGSWALVGDDSLTGIVYTFQQGKIFIYESRERYFYKDGTIWDCPPDAFRLNDCGYFQIRDSCLYLGGGSLNLGKISFSSDKMILDSVEYSKLSYGWSPVPHNDQNHITSVKLEKHDVYMNVGESITIAVNISPQNAVDRRLVWRSSEPSVAEVDETGLIVAKALCDTSVNVIVNSFFGEKSDTCRVTVRNILSSKGTANCYIVRNGGRYCFDASVKGNSSEKTGVGAYADVIWETKCQSKAPERHSLISDCTFDWRSGMLSFTAAASVAGNALVALCDKNGTILWSWHIWLAPGFNPDLNAQEYYNNAGIVMDRNLGALTADPAFQESTYGLLYQWGRKDPFVHQNLKAAYAVDMQCEYVPSDQNTGNIPYTVAHPTTFLTGAQSGDWLLGESSDFSRWKPSEKTKYDPCPPGWRVPSYELWLKAVSSQGSPKVKGSGIDFKGYFSDEAVWYPKAFWIESGEFIGTSGGRYWGATDSCKDPLLRQQMYINAENNCGIENCKPFFGCSVRCVKE